jgi:hypothetical protein
MRDSIKKLLSISFLNNNLEAKYAIGASRYIYPNYRFVAANKFTYRQEKKSTFTN